MKNVPIFSGTLGSASFRKGPSMIPVLRQLNVSSHPVLTLEVMNLIYITCSRIQLSPLRKQIATPLVALSV